MPALTKLELIDLVVQELGIDIERATPAVDAVFDLITETLARGESVEVRGFGGISVRQYKAYEGRNPKTGETVHVSPKRLPHFRIGKDLHERINAAPTLGQAVASKPAALATKAERSGDEPKEATQDRTRSPRKLPVAGLSEDSI